MTAPTAPHLVADVGGTNVRFALVVAGRPSAARDLRGDDYPSLAAAAAAYLEGVEARPRAAAFAVPCPVEGDRVVPTNRPAWAFSTDALRAELGLERLEVLNDFEAQALALPDLGAADLSSLHDARGLAGAPRAVLGPGTGLGVAALVEVGDRRLALPGEGGHRDLAAASEREWRVFEALRDRYGHVSCERVLSGPGLAELYGILRRLDGHAATGGIGPSTVVERAGAGEPHGREAVEVFCAQLGAVAGDLVLTLGARRGVFVAGGVVGKMGGCFRRDAFLDRYLGKGRFRAYLEAVPVHLVVHPHAALLGAAWVLRRQS